MIEYRCPKCERVSQFGDEHAGAARRCTGCDTEFTVPAAQAPVPGTGSSPLTRFLGRLVGYAILGIACICLVAYVMARPLTPLIVLQGAGIGAALGAFRGLMNWKR